jgi:uncharacterized protein YbgA (DUF1722 family)/uncharacterized protein YbbK (DUF523 family)
MTNVFPTPHIVVSGCLDFEACRYNGQVLPFELIAEFSPFVEWRPICPEMEIGLGTPRDPIRLVAKGERQLLVQPATGRDVTTDMNAFSDSFLDRTADVDGFILKSRSPSCGLNGVKVYHTPDSPMTTGRAPGLFAAKVLERHPDIAIEDEGRLRNYRIREHFLTKVFALARLREIGSMRDLVQFQSVYKLVLMAYNQNKMRELGRLVANPDRRPLADVLPEYRAGFGAALRTAPRYTSVINVIEHAFGYFSKKLDAREKAFYRAQLQRYRDGRIPVSGLTSVVLAWATRFDVEYLLMQALFHPYPEELMNLSDSGKGRSARTR